MLCKKALVGLRISGKKSIVSKHNIYKYHHHTYYTIYRCFILYIGIYLCIYNIIFMYVFYIIHECTSQTIRAVRDLLASVDRRSYE